jgi:hypothetical protein
MSIPFLADSPERRRNHPRLAAVKSMPASSDAKVEPPMVTCRLSPSSVGSWKLPASRREHAPAGAVEPKRLGDPPALVEEEVEVAVDRIEPEPPDGTSESVERAAHVEGFDRDEHAHRGGQAQHARSASSTRRSVDAEASSPNSNRASSTTRTYRAAGPPRGISGTSSTSACADDGGAARRLGAVLLLPSRFTSQPCSDRPSIP